MKKTVFNFALALALAVNTAVFASGDTEIFSGGKITLSGKAEKNASVALNSSAVIPSIKTVTFTEAIFSAFP